MKHDSQPQLPFDGDWGSDPFILVNIHTLTFHSAQAPEPGCHLTEAGLAGHIVPMRRSATALFRLDACRRCFPLGGWPTAA